MAYTPAINASEHSRLCGQIESASGKAVTAAFPKRWPSVSGWLQLALAGVLLLLSSGLSANTIGNLLAHGASDRYWYAVVEQVQGQWVTHVWYRAVNSAQWKPLADVPGQAISLAQYRGELLLVSSDGQWNRLSDQYVSGPQLPDHNAILAMAGGSDALWAAGGGAGNPTTRLAAAGPTSITATAPATQAFQPALYRFTGGQWLRRANLPSTSLPVRQSDVSLALIHDELHLAIPVSGEEIGLFRYDASTNRWIESTRLASPTPLELKLMTIGDGAALWAGGINGQPGTLWFRAPAGSWSGAKRISFDSPASLVAFSAAAAGDEVRILALSTDLNLLEQKYGVGGDVTQPLKPVADSHSLPETPGWTQLLVLTLLGAFVLTNLTRRRPVQIIEIDKVRMALAPLSLRLLAGAIDAIPVIGALVAAAPYAPRAASWQQILSSGWAARWIVLGSWAVYVLHPMLFELIWSRSVGKMCTGLRVVDIQGQRPRARDIIIRNALRLIDVLLGFSLIAVFFSPLRQRLGDIPAGTLVIVKLPQNASLEGDPDRSRAN